MTQTLDRRTFIGAVAAGMIAAPLTANSQTNVSPSGTTVPPAASITDANGGIWTLGAATQYGFKILLNGNWAAKGHAVLMSWRNGQLKNQNNIGDWWLWTGSGYVSTTAPDVDLPPPGDEPFATGSVGTLNVAQGAWSLAGGSGSETGVGANGAFAWGQGAQALGGGSIAFGRGAKSMYTDTFVVGQGCRADGDNGRAAGWACHSYGDAGFAHGYQASDRGILGLEAYSSGSFGTGSEDLGSATAQMARAVLRVQTNTAISTPLTTDGRAFGFDNQSRLPDDASFVLQWLVVARDISNGNSRAWRVQVLATRGIGAGSTTVFTPLIADIGQSPGASGWGVSVTADTYNGAAQLNGIGAAGRPIQWVAAMIDGENVG